MKYFSLIWCFFCCVCFAQKLEQERKVAVEENKKFVGTDLLNQSYFLKDNNLIIEKANDTFQYTNNKWGIPTDVSILTNLSVLIFYKNNNAFVLLDAQGNEIISKQFVEINASHVFPASQNEVWFYDELSQKLGLYNLNAERIKFVSTPFVLKNSCSADFNFFYYINDENELIRISKFGQQKKLTTLVAQKFILVFQNEIYYLKDSSLYIKNIASNTDSKLFEDEKIVENFFISEQKIAIFTQNEITTYKIIE